MENNNSLVVIWTSGDKEVALKTVFMYTYNSKRLGWWQDVELVVWGPSSKLLSEDIELQKQVKTMIDSGVTVQACKACSDSYGVSGVLESIGISVIYMGESLTRYLKENKKVLTF